MGKKGRKKHAGSEEDDENSALSGMVAELKELRKELQELRKENAALKKAGSGDAPGAKGSAKGSTTAGGSPGKGGAQPNAGAGSAQPTDGWTVKPLKSKDKAHKPVESVLGSLKAPVKPPEPLASGEEMDESSMAGGLFGGLFTEEAAPPEPVHPDGVDPEHWSHEECKYGGKDGIQMGQAGFVRFKRDSVAQKIMHDFSQSRQPVAALTTSPLTEASKLCPVKIWKDGQKKLEWLYLTPIGRAEEKVAFEPPGDEEPPDGFADTEVLVCSIVQNWLTKAEWEMFKDAETLKPVLRSWLQQHKLEDLVESMFHPQIFGDPQAGDATATVSLRIIREERERILAVAGEGGVVPRPLEKGPPEVVWLPPWDPSPAAFQRLRELGQRTQGARGVAISPKGPGIRVKPELLEEKAHELLGEGAPAFIRHTFGKRFDVSGIPWDLSRRAVQRLLETKNWRVEVDTDREGRMGRIWKVIAAPEDPVPEDFRFRGR